MECRSWSYIAMSGLHQAGSWCHEEPLPMLFNLCRGGMEWLSNVFLYGDRVIRVQPHWIRDYVLSLKGFRYTETEVRSFPDLLLEHQHEKGFFYEIVTPVTDIHSGIPKRMNELGKLVGITPEECHYHEEGLELGLCRLELEADIEYLMVEGVYMIWQSVGDDDYLRLNLPRLEKGLHYMESDPLRWDRTHGLVKRARTLDSWDFLDRKSSGYDRQVRPDDPMGLFHGDNTGLYHAHVLMSRMYRTVGDEEAARRHEKLGAELRERIMKTLWNGEFFAHFVPLTPVDYGVDEWRQMSLSNAYALNRELLTFDQRLSILNAYRRLRKTYGGEMDDFRNLEPPYPEFNGMPAGRYVNGANAPFVAGQLALAAFELGEEEYGVDILTRVGSKVSRDGKFVFLWDWEGKDIGGGPRCWSAAEILNAECSGLAGVVDRDKLMRNLSLSPRFAAAREKHAHVRLEYGASGAHVEYVFRGDYEARRLSFTLLSEHEQVLLRLYVPDGGAPTAMTVNGAPVDFRDEVVGRSHYGVLTGLERGAQVELSYA